LFDLDSSVTLQSFWLGLKRFGQTLFIRPCYPPLFDKVSAAWQSQRLTVGIFGTPGTGKTFFLFYAFMRCVLDHPDKVFLFLSKYFSYKFHSGTPPECMDSPKMEPYFADYIFCDDILPPECNAYCLMGQSGDSNRADERDRKFYNSLCHSGLWKK
jgi:hypothetical protein